MSEETDEIPRGTYRDYSDRLLRKFATRGRTLREWEILDASASIKTHLGLAGGPQPRWLCDAGLELCARVIDYLPNSPTCQDMCNFLERLGFRVTKNSPEESGIAQQGLSCGIVASEAAVIMQRAGEQWEAVDVSVAADCECVRRARRPGRPPAFVC